MQWNEIKNQEDADHLMKVFGRFHDACVREAHLSTEHWVGDNLTMACTGNLDTTIRFVVQRQFQPISCIELVFEKVIRLSWVPTPDNYDSIIYGATIGFEEGDVYWSLEESGPPSELDPREDTWVIAKYLKWRVADEWLGKSLHYGPSEYSA